MFHFPPVPPPAPVAAAASAMKAAAVAATTHGPTMAATLGKFSGYFELVGGILIVLGLFTRVAGFVLSGEMAFAYFLVHAPKSFFPIQTGGNGGELAILYCFIFLFFVFSGPGPFALDRALRKKI